MRARGKRSVRWSGGQCRGLPTPPSPLDCRNPRVGLALPRDPLQFRVAEERPPHSHSQHISIPRPHFHSRSRVDGARKSRPQSHSRSAGRRRAAFQSRRTRDYSPLGPPQDSQREPPRESLQDQPREQRFAQTTRTGLGKAALQTANGSRRIPDSRD